MCYAMPMASKQKIKIPETRVDRAELRKPRVLDDGTKIFEACLATADEPLVYPWGIEYPTKEALSDPEYLEALRGISVVVFHPEDREIKNGKAPKSGAGRRMGQNLSARFDESTNKVLVELAIPESEDQALIETALGQVSEGYTPVLKQRTDGAYDQIKRKPNHIAVVDEGRADKPYIRTDQKEGSKMTLEELVSKLQDLVSNATASKEAIDSAKQEADMVRSDSKKMVEFIDAVAKELGEDVRNDAAKVSSAIRARCEIEGNLIAGLREKAQALKVTVPATAKDSQSIRKSIALSIGAEQTRCDSADYCDGLIDAAVKSASQATAEVRNDSKDQSYPV